jgi:HAD superfamily phosphatase
LYLAHSLEDRRRFFYKIILNPLKGNMGTNPRILLALDIDGVVRDVSQSYRRALADTVEHFTKGAFRPSEMEIDQLKAEGRWNNDWEGSQELVYRYLERQGTIGGASPKENRQAYPLDFEQLVEYFQRRYLGTPEQLDGYIQDEPLLVDLSYFERLDQEKIYWGFVSGASRRSAEHVLARVGLHGVPLVAMGEAAEKPNPEGLLHLANSGKALDQIFYAGDTVADMHTVLNAQTQDPSRTYLAIGVVPPHLWESDRESDYISTLKTAGAHVVVKRMTDITVELLREI